MRTSAIKILAESLHPADLEGMVDDLVSVDEYVPKIDPEAVVVAFSCRSPTAAADLLSWLWSGAWPGMLDVDIENIPDTKGRIRVYVEYGRSPGCGRHIETMLQDLRAVVGDQQLRLRFPGHRIVPFRPGVVTEFLSEKLSKSTSGAVRGKMEEVAEFLGCDFDDDGPVLMAGGRLYRPVCFAEERRLARVLAERQIHMAESFVAEAARLEARLGPDYSVTPVGNWYVVRRGNDDRLCLLVGEGP